MTICPYCDEENIDGADSCARCEVSLSDLHLPAPEGELEQALLGDRIDVLQPGQLIVVDRSASVASVLQLMLDRRIGCVFVTECGAVVGVFTERDALNRLHIDVAEHAARPIADFMTPRPQSLRATAKVAFAARLMDQGGFRHVLVLDQQGQPSGVASARDLLRYLTRRHRAAAS